MLDQSRIGADPHAATPTRCSAAAGDGDAHPEHQSGVGRARPGARSSAALRATDLFVCVHEQFMTETAQMADVVLPATMFLEHDDIYQGGGHQYIMLGPKLIEPPGECRTNHEVICGLAKRLGAEHPGFDMSAARADRLDAAQVRLGHARRARSQPLDRLPAAVRHRALSRRLRLAGRQVPLQAGLDERAVPQPRARAGRSPPCRRCPTIGTSIEEADAEHPFRLAHLAGARLPQLDLQRDADLAGAGSAART